MIQSKVALSTKQIIKNLNFYKTKFSIRRSQNPKFPREEMLKSHAMNIYKI